MPVFRASLRLQLAVTGATILLLAGAPSALGASVSAAQLQLPSASAVGLAPKTLSAPGGQVIAWTGNNYYGQATVPAGLSGVTAIAAGLTHSIALRSNGTVVAWGWDFYGQTDVPVGLANVTAISTGAYQNLALKANGTVTAWGWDAEGQTDVPSGLGDIVEVAAGGYHSLALKADGMVVGWGDNFYGQATSPAGLTHVTAIAGGYFHSLALKSNGTVAAWGDNTYGQSTVPVGLSAVTAIAGGIGFSIALKADGTVVAWGDDTWGQTNVPAGLAHVVAIAAGPFHSLALKSDGTVVGWGMDEIGSIDIPPGLTGVLAIAAGQYHSLAIVPAAAGDAAIFKVRTTDPYVAGAAHTVTVSALDASGQVATSYRGTIHFSSSDPRATVPADYTFTVADAGVHRFSYNLRPRLVLKTAGRQWIRTTDTGNRSITGSQTVVVKAGAARTLTICTTSPYDAGAAHSVTVTARDAFGNVATGYRGTIRFSSSDPRASLPLDYTFTAADGGTHTFRYWLRPSLILRTDGRQWVRATDLSHPWITGAERVIVN